YCWLNDEMVQELKFLTQLEILKKKFLDHIFYKQNVYNVIYKNCNNRNELNSDSSSFLSTILEKKDQDANWKVFVQHTNNEYHLSDIFWISPS
ncbi:33814_t:CDS:1, partial [Racocetra persica]